MNSTCSNCSFLQEQCIELRNELQSLRNELKSLKNEIQSLQTPNVICDTLEVRAQTNESVQSGNNSEIDLHSESSDILFNLFVEADRNYSSINAAHGTPSADLAYDSQDSYHY